MHDVRKILLTPPPYKNPGSAPVHCKLKHVLKGDELAVPQTVNVIRTLSHSLHTFYNVSLAAIDSSVLVYSINYLYFNSPSEFFGYLVREPTQIYINITELEEPYTHNIVACDLYANAKSQTMCCSDFIFS